MSTALVERMAVEVAGNGEPILLVHGLGGSSNVWTPQLGILSGRRIVRPDLPGAGRSPRPSSPPSIQGFVDALARMARFLGIDRADVAAHSLGTIIACHLAAQHPGLVRRLALFGALLAPADAARQGLRDRARKVREEGMAGVADTVLGAATSTDTKAGQPVTVAFIRELLMRQDAEGYAMTCEALAAAEPADLSRVRCRTLLVTGDEDAIAPPSGARAMAERLEGARLEILPRCGHWTTLERAGDVNRILRDFLSGRG